MKTTLCAMGGLAIVAMVLFISIVGMMYEGGVWP